MQGIYVACLLNNKVQRSSLNCFYHQNSICFYNKMLHVSTPKGYYQTQMYKRKVANMQRCMQTEKLLL